MTELQKNGFHEEEKRLILIVDDEVTNQAILKGILEEQFEILTAGTGTDALAVIHENRERLRLVMLDLIMPGMHGMEVLKRLRLNPDLMHIPVIVLTSDKNAEVECLKAGAIDFIPKPYPGKEVILARAKRIIELFEGRDLIRMTERDPLTGLYHREYFYRYAEKYDLYHPQQKMDAIVVDINHFHILNERFGKEYGDRVLKGIAEKSREIVTKTGGLVCRLEADTFLLYTIHRYDYSALHEFLSHGLSENSDSDYRIRIRLGVYPDVDKSLDMERRFDRAKMASDTIRGSFAKTIAIYDDALHDIELFEDQLLGDFQAALEEEQFLVYYQPKFDIRPATPVLSSAEALVRWDHPQLGMVSPCVFIPLFEQHGLIRDLDQYVWRKTAEKMRDWKERLGFSVPVSVNVSRIDMYDPELVNEIFALLDEFGLQPSDLFLEITESAYTQDSEQIIETVHRMRSGGLKVEMDDFGTGYSSLNMVSKLPIDVLKLDIQFIRNAFSERKDTRMLEIILDIADSLNVPTIAEGVETAEQMTTLRMMGCTYAQGYYFSKPIPPLEFEVFLREKKRLETEANGVLPQPEKIEPHRTTTGRAIDNITYNSLHDPLTGLYNASAYELLFRDADQTHLALLLAEVDGYKFLCDRYGMTTADQTIKRIADEMRRSFRSVDPICRISQSEFVVIMSRVASSQFETIKEKFDQINQTLSREEDGLPAVSLTAGLAFSDQNDPEADIFRKADAALQKAIEAGNRGSVLQAGGPRNNTEDR